MRFSLLHFFYLTAVICAGASLFPSTAAISWIALIVFFWIMASVYFDVVESWHWDTELTMLGAILGVGIAFGAMCYFLTTQPAGTTGVRARTESSGKMREIGLAILNYEHANGNFPPARIVDNDGRPKHSWRVLILPYLGYQTLYDEYDFDEPWDGPNNRKLVNRIDLDAPFFNSERNRNRFETTVKVIVGPDTVVGGSVPKTLPLAVDTSNVILAIEDSRKPICWMQPDDLTVEQAVEILRSEPLERLSERMFERRSTKFRNIVFADGSVAGVVRINAPDLTVAKMFSVTSPQTEEIGSFQVAFETDSTEIRTDSLLVAILNFGLLICPLFWRSLLLSQRRPMVLTK